MTLSQALTTARLVRPTRRVGFCPACRFFLRPADQAGDAGVELTPPALVVLAHLALAGVAWAWMVPRSQGNDMAMGLGSLPSFAASWGVMMAAMMLPSATPLIFEFARSAEGRRRWQAATGVLGATYLSIWLAFGVACYAALRPLPMSWTEGALPGGVSLAVAGLYALTPVKRASEAACREACALHGPLPFNLMRSAALVGVKYGVSCIGCSGALMVAMVLIGMSNLGWMIILGGVVLVYKLAPAFSMRQTLLASAALGVLGAVYVLMG